MPKCVNCGGTGTEYLDKCWFVQDGIRASKCGSCSGTGKSDSRDFCGSAARQKIKREVITKFGSVHAYNAAVAADKSACPWWHR